MDHHPAAGGGLALDRTLTALITRNFDDSLAIC
jgi:hypothetical protein